MKKALILAIVCVLLFPLIAPGSIVKAKENVTTVEPFFEGDEFLRGTTKPGASVFFETDKGNLPMTVADKEGNFIAKMPSNIRAGEWIDVWTTDGDIYVLDQVVITVKAADQTAIPAGKKLVNPDIIRVYENLSHSAALTRDGSLWMWGGNDEGQLGSGTLYTYKDPILVSGISKVKSVVLGMNETYVLKQDGTVWGWGKYVNSRIPIKFDNLSNIVSIHLALDPNGPRSFYAIKNDGSLWVWYSEFGRKAKKLSKDHDFLSIVEIPYTFNYQPFDLKLSKDRTVWARYGNLFGQLGDGTFTGKKDFIKVKNLNRITQIDASENAHSIALREDGTVWTWGNNDFGQLGDGTKENRSVPVNVLDHATKVAASGNNSLALKDDGTVWVWGSNNVGQLGDGTMSETIKIHDGTIFGKMETVEDRGTTIPKQVPNLSDIIDISTDRGSILALKNDGTVWRWGDRTTTPKQVLFMVDVENDVRPQHYDISGHWAESAIRALIEADVVSGYEDGSFKPDGKVTREQFVKMLVQALGLQFVQEKTSFDDIPTSRWSNKYIEAAIDKGIIVRSEHGTKFNPDKAITRSEMAVMAARSLELTENESATAFKDSSLITEHRGLVGANVEAGIISGFEDNTFRPNDNATRAQAAVIIVRIIDKNK